MASRAGERSTVRGTRQKGVLIPVLIASFLPWSAASAQPPGTTRDCNARS